MAYTSQRYLVGSLLLVFAARFGNTQQAFCRALKQNLDEFSLFSFQNSLPKIIFSLLSQYDFFF